MPRTKSKTLKSQRRILSRWDWNTIVSVVSILLVLIVISVIYSFGYFESRSAHQYKTCMFHELIRVRAIEPAAQTCLKGMISNSSKRNKIEPELVWAVIYAESNFNHRAVSSKGAFGLMQIMPNTAADLGLKDPFDPEGNIEAGSRYLKKLIDKHQGNLKHAIAAYNAGSSNVERFKGVPPYEETRNYVNRVLAIYQKEILKRGATSQ